eukprot:6281298-Amphidinium_carterae.1
MNAAMAMIFWNRKEISHLSTLRREVALLGDIVVAERVESEARERMRVMMRRTRGMIKALTCVVARSISLRGLP